MDACTRCGAELGIGRFCTNCGQPVSAPTEETSPFFAPTVADHEPGGGRAPWLPWVAGLVILVLIGATGTWLLVANADDEPAQALETPTRSADRGPSRATASDTTPTPRPSRKPSPEVAAEPVDLTATTEVSAPAPAPASQDSSGNSVSYVAAHMLDGVPQTTWRMPADGTGSTITFSFDSRVVLTEVGLVNGYAKVGEDSAGLLDWYAGNRRIFGVEWTFDDGTVVAQSLREAAELQTIAVRDVRTKTVTLRLIEVSTPGEGRSSRDFTAISDVRLLGTSTTR